ncbi:molybdopterin-binding protein [Saxibacter everestensis]|uniref:Molybdopterin-binding protein n=1 Tax=Saxibacter everestensis TaxID=2909229 RepID=A0ABY8QWD9_9MICO|nr:molybdopterin-binding protein [Brevibacteriaceae bacterium ZFBP1038]
MNSEESRRTALVIVASTRAANEVYDDVSGPELVKGLSSWGFAVTGPQVVADGDPVAHALKSAAGRYDVILTTGGTGITPTDTTPEVTEPLLDRQLPGIQELLRAEGVRKGIPTAVLSRGLAGVAKGSLVINLPGSRGAVRDALAVLADVIEHAVAQIAGSDHESRAPGRPEFRMPTVQPDAQHGEA